MIITGAVIDSVGAFTFDIDFLPKEDRLYRLHITKKEAPVSSLIIGGKDQNHLFIVANNTSNITIEGSRNAIFNGALIKENAHNESLLRIDQMASSLDSISYKMTALQRDFETKVIYDKLRMIADTSSHSLVSLYALYKTRFRADFEKNTDYYNRYYEKWENENSSYFQAFRRDVPVKKENRIVIYLVIVLLLFFGIALAYFLYKKKRSNSQDQIAALSVQERKVFALLELGKSNKEISQELNIGVNTVKSHVSSIYSKLDISSRKEVLKLR
jgi:DNA-binding CsgD family transcriptional regulator